MTNAEWVVVGYIAVLLAALGLAVKNRKTFPLTESVMVLLLVGFGFTGLVYLAAMLVRPAQISPPVSLASLVFTGVYVVVVAALLVLRPESKKEKALFLREKIAVISFKLSVFVLIPLILMRTLWGWSWAELGFRAGDVPGQLIAAVILILIFGGFNYLAGSAAKPIRQGDFTGSQVAAGFTIAFVWNLFETGLVEEFFFRAFLQTQFIHALDSPLAGISLTSLVFGLAHAPGIYLRKGDQLGPLGEKPSLLNSIVYSVIVLSSAGWFTGLLYWRTQSLLAPILVHAVVDGVAHTAEFIQGLRLVAKKEPLTNL